MTGWGALEGEEVLGRGEPVRASVGIPGEQLWVHQHASPDALSFPASRLMVE